MSTIHAKTYEAATLYEFSADKFDALPASETYTYAVTFSGENGEGIAHVHSLDGYGLDYAVGRLIKT